MSEINSNYKVFSGTNSRHLAEAICAHLDEKERRNGNIRGCQLGHINMEHFSDGEFAVSFEESVRGCHVYLVQSTNPTSDNLMELLLMIDAAKRASAYKVAAVIPYFGWARQDRKDKPRVSIGAKLVASMLQVAGADRVLTMDLHADQIQGFFDIPLDHLHGSSIFVEYISSLRLENLVIASPDVGGSKRANTYAKKLAAPLVLCHKSREKANVIADMRIIGDVEDKDVVIIDDMADTAGTLCRAADLMMANGAKSVRAVVSHGVMSGKACENIMNSQLTEIVFTDSIPFDQTRCPKAHVVSVADIFAETIFRNQNHISISDLYV